MKKSFAILVAVLVTLCASTTALAETPAPTPVDVPQIKVASVPSLYYSRGDLQLSAPRVIWRSPSFVEIEEGATITLSVQFAGVPFPEVLLFWDGELFDPRADPIYIAGVTVGSSTGYAYLTIKAVVPADSGTYSFQLVNHQGLATVYMTLLVKEKE